MKNIAIIFTLLLLPYCVLSLAHVPEPWAGTVSVALVFAFTGIGHFVKTEGMAQMLPPWVPMRVPTIYATGVLELAGAAAILVPAVSRFAGIALCGFLVLVLPSNIY